VHYGREESTTAVVESDAKALGHYGLTMVLLVDHNPHELTMTLMIWPLLVDHVPHELTIALISWLRPLLDFDVVLEDYYHYIRVVLITMLDVNVPLL